MSDGIVNTSTGPLTHRERFNRLMHFQPVDRIVHWEFGYLEETMARWHGEGLPRDITGHTPIEAYFGVDPQEKVPVALGIVPSFEGDNEILKEKEHTVVVRIPDGTVKEVQKGGDRSTIPRYLKMPIENRDDWKRYRERLDPKDPARFETDWRTLGEELNASDRPVGINIGSYLGWPRNWIGFENIALMCYDDRKLVEEIVATLGEVYYTQIEAALQHCRVDFGYGWEDICFRNGPLVSPAMFRDLVLPHLKRVCDLLKSHGCDVIWTDCDGNINDLVPIWLEAGVNCMFPIEVQAGSDPVALREEYGTKILLRGGLAKHEFAKGRKETLAELRRVEKVLAQGGFIPHGDHRIPDDVPYDIYRYYIKEKLNMLGWRREDIDAVEPLRGM